MVEFIPRPSHPSSLCLCPSRSPQQHRRLVREKLALGEHLHDIRGVGGFEFPREESLWEKEEMEGRWAFRKGGVKGQSHYQKEENRMHAVERVPTRHSKGRSTLEVPKGCMVDLGRHLHTPLHRWA